MQRLTFGYSPAFIFICIALGVGYAWLLYQKKSVWSKRTNYILFGLRAVVVSFLSFLLIGPIVKLTNNLFEKPSLVFLIDNSKSMQSGDSLQLQQKLKNATGLLEKQGYDVKWNDLSNQPIQKINFKNTSTDISGAIKGITNEYEGKNLAAIVLVSDGIYNTGTSPLYTPLRVPLYAIGTGDTTAHADLILKNVVYNKIAYQGNQFPLRAEVLVQGLSNQEVKVSVYKAGKVLRTEKQNSGSKSILDFNFLVDASEKGTQRLDIVVETIAAETNRRNNSASAFVEVVEGKKKILVIAPSPHPDLKALRSVVEKNSNYELIVHIPGVTKTDPAILQPGKAELVIFHQVLDEDSKTQALFTQLSKSTSSLLLMIGAKTSLRTLNANGIPMTFQSNGQRDQITPVINASFHDFTFSDNSNGIFSKYPPIDVPFGKFTYPQQSGIMLYQRIGSVTTDRPLLFSWIDNNKKIAVMLGEGIWRWRLNEFAATEKTEAFDDLFSRVIQYLSTQEDKRKFRCFPLENEFSDAAPVVLESQVYNDLYELVYGNKIEIELRDEKGKKTSYNYVTSPGGSQYRIGGLKEGVYYYKASTLINGKKEEVSGQFLVKAQNIETQNMVADFGLLRRLSASTGGKFYSVNQFNDFTNDWKKTEAKSLIHSEESFDPLINLKLIFFLLVALISAEWFVRKYMGSY